MNEYQIRLTIDRNAFTYQIKASGKLDALKPALKIREMFPTARADIEFEECEDWGEYPIFEGGAK